LGVGEPIDYYLNLMADIKIGIIGGSGLYKMEALQNVEEVKVTTPFGDPSDALIVGELNGTKVVFIARHNRNHNLTPSEVPYRANIHAMKQMGVEYLISASAVGSLREEVKPLDLVLPDQFIDRTKGRQSTFFGDGIVAHIAFGEPICPQLQQVLADSIASLNLPDITCHQGGTYVCMEGPAFSTKAESNMYRQLGGTIIGMTNLPEAKLAREAEMAYATLALSTDYDCWHPDHDSVTVEMVIANLGKNAVNAQRVIQETVQRITAKPFVSVAHNALQYAIITPPAGMNPATKDKLKLLIGKYVN
jgi:5'-methylthioadenosine phosphorylase